MLSPIFPELFLFPDFVFKMVSNVKLNFSPDNRSCPTFGLASVLMLIPISPDLVLFQDFEFRTSLGTSVLHIQCKWLHVISNFKSLTGLSMYSIEYFVFHVIFLLYTEKINVITLQQMRSIWIKSYHYHHSHIKQSTIQYHNHFITLHILLCSWSVYQR